MDTTPGDTLPEVSDLDSPEAPAILEEIEIEDLAVDGICGVY
jgi:mycofactocin precursor